MVTYRDATLADLPDDRALLAEDQIGGRNGRPEAEPLDPVYAAAFAAIDGDSNQRLIVAEIDGAIVGTMQLSYLPACSIAARGADRSRRCASLPTGAAKASARTMIGWAVEQCRARGCFMAQLTSNNGRVAAHRFYERLGWQKSHAGFKLYLTEDH